MITRGDCWAGKLSEEQIEQAYAMALTFNPRHAALPELCKKFALAKRPSPTAFYRWLKKTEKVTWRWRLKHAVSVAKTMQAALPDEADALFRDSLVALGVDAAVQNDPKFALAIAKTLSAMNKDRESRLNAQIEELKSRIETILADQQRAAAPLDPARLAAAVDEVLGRKKAEVGGQRSEEEKTNVSSNATP
jgi:hypothetical protein